MSSPSAFMSCMALQDHLIMTISTSEASLFPHVTWQNPKDHQKELKVKRPSSVLEEGLFQNTFVLGSPLSDRQEEKYHSSQRGP